MITMRCPTCQHNGTKVLDSRPVHSGRSIRRRRECESCSYRFTTFETVEQTPLIIVKKGGEREEFSREKILRGLIKACEKRPVPLETLENIVDSKFCIEVLGSSLLKKYCSSFFSMNLVFSKYTVF